LNVVSRDPEAVTLAIFMTELLSDTSAIKLPSLWKWNEPSKEFAPGMTSTSAKPSGLKSGVRDPFGL
jgi:hypothetical protein